jgi:cytoskeletal protein CcmA (bactofilin family)
MLNPLSHIASQHLVDGFIQAREDLFVEGHVRGRLKSTGKVTVGRDGILEGDIQLQTLVVQGVVVGTVLASHDVIVEATGQIKGAIRAGRLTVHPGGRIAAQVEAGSSVQTQLAEAGRSQHKDLPVKTRQSQENRKRKRVRKEKANVAAVEEVPADPAAMAPGRETNTYSPEHRSNPTDSDQVETVEMAEDMVEDAVAIESLTKDDSAPETVELSPPVQEEESGEVVQSTVAQPPHS